MISNNRIQRLHDKLGLLISASKPGARLPSEPELARQLGISRATLREAMRTFETQGIISRRQGIGTFVMRPAHVIETGLEVLESIDTLAKRIGLEVCMGAAKIAVRKPQPEEAEILGLQPGAQVTDVSRAIIAEQRPVAYLIDIVPTHLLPPEDLGTDFKGSVLDLLLRRNNLALVNSYCEINAVGATAELARALDIQRGAPLLRFIARLYAVDGTVVDYSFSYFLPGYFRFHVVRALGRPSDFYPGSAT